MSLHQKHCFGLIPIQLSHHALQIQRSGGRFLTLHAEHFLFLKELNRF
jgi:hypothetical protein